MSIVKKQHYVPQFYLRRFAQTDTRINVFDKFNQKAFLANTKDVASSNYFYDLSLELVEDLKASLDEFREEGKLTDEVAAEVVKEIESLQIVEKRLSRWESRFARVLDEVIETLDRRRRFKDKFREDLALLVASQFWRTATIREGMLELEQKLEERIMDIVQRMNKVNGTNYTATDLEIEFNPQQTADRHKFLVFDTDNLYETAKIFLNHIWIIGMNDTTQALYTSDNPVARRAHKTDDWRSNIGIASPGVEIMFPLSPKYTLTMYERSYFEHIEIHDGKIIPLKNDHILYQNSHQVLWSNRQIYSPTNQFALIEEMMRKDPRLTKSRPQWG